MPADLSHELPEEAALLGTPTAVFRTRRSRAVLFLIGGVIAILFGIAMGSVFLSRPFLQPPAGQPPADPGDLISSLVLTVVSLAGGVGLIYRARQTGALRVFIFPDGLARVERDKVDIVYWKEVRLVRGGPETRRNESTLSTPDQLVLEQTDGPILAFNETLVRLRELRELVEERTLPHLLPPTLQAFRAGRTLRFGIIGVSRDGLAVGDGMLAWNDVESAEVVKGMLVIRARHPGATWRKFPRSQVPNLHVLVALIERVGAEGA
jgi:hypothetical protein